MLQNVGKVSYFNENMPLIIFSHLCINYYASFTHKVGYKNIADAT